MQRKSDLSRILWLSAAFLPFGITEGWAQTAEPAAPIALPEVDVIATSPLPGGGESRDNIPAMVQTLPAEDFARTNSQNVTDTLQQRIPAAVSIDINGNPFSQDLRYRGFVASPLQGTPARPRRLSERHSRQRGFWRHRQLGSHSAASHLPSRHFHE